MFTGHFSRLVRAAILCAALVSTHLMTTTSAQMPSTTYTVLYSFGTTTNDPLQPHGIGEITQGRDGDLYTTSSAGGTSNVGTMFKVTPSGAVSVVYDFSYNPGNDPLSGVTLGTDGNYYGTTVLNGEGPGTLYKITPAGVATALHYFGNAGDGACPYAPPIQSTDGNYYGTTTTVCGFGSLSTVYKVTSAGVLTTLYTFTDGSNITGPLVQGTDGNFYGTAVSGGTSNDGFIFKITSAGLITVLHNLTGADGAQAYSGVIQATDGNFYGVTSTGGSSNAGVVFKVTSSGTYTVLHNLNGTTDGNGPFSGLMQATDGKLYGTANGGGSSSMGTLFNITTSGTFTVLVNFSGANGSLPNSPLKQNTNGILYGDTYYGGNVSLCSNNGCGVFYSLNIGAKAFINLPTTSGKVGSKIGIFGQGFSSSSVVKFNGVTATSVTRSGTTYLTATVPTGASNGFVTVKTGSTTLTSTQKFTVHNSWSSGKAMTAGVQWPMTGTIGGKIYVVGGYTATEPVANNQVYNPTTNTWSSGAALPTAMAQGATAVVNNVLYVFGGSADGGRHGDQCRVGLQSDDELVVLKSRDAHGAMQYGGCRRQGNCLRDRRLQRQPAEHRRKLQSHDQYMDVGSASAGRQVGDFGRADLNDDRGLRWFCQRWGHRRYGRLQRDHEYLDGAHQRFRSPQRGLRRGHQWESLRGGRKRQLE